MMENSQTPITIPHYISSFELEEARLGQSIEKCSRQLAALNEESLLNILHNSDLIKNTLRLIKNESINAEYALNDVATKSVEELEAQEDPQLKKRAADIRAVTVRLLNIILKVN